MGSLEDSVPTTGEGTESATDAKEGARARRLANLRRPWSKGETGNARGVNGRDKNKVVQEFLDALDDDQADCTRIEVVLRATYDSAKNGEGAAQKTLIEQYAGRARVSEAEFKLLVAEHMRKVARDAADLAVKILGSRLYTMSPQELAAFFRECSGNTEGFIEAAKAETEQPEGATVEEQPVSVVEPMPAPPESTPVLPDSDEGWPKP